jgi:nucleoside-diphosphate-sugar epimerase
VRILVTGAPGFIGSEVVRALLADGHEVACLGRPGEDLGRLAGTEGRVAMREIELADSSGVERLIEELRPEVVVHLAWYAHPRDYLTSSENLGSLRDTVRLGELAFRSGCRKFVGAGTCLEYAESSEIRREGASDEPVSLYASCKLAAWMVLRALGAAARAEVAWGRVFHLHGPRESPERLLPWVAREVALGRAVELTDGTQVRDHLHVADVAAGFAALVQPGAAGVYNISSGAVVTLREVVATVGRLAGDPALLRFGARPHRPGETMFLVGDSSRLRALGWQPRHSLEGGLGDAVAGYLGRASLPD